jgi:hypothetical protein
LRTTIRFRGDYQNLRKFPNADVDKEIQLSFSEFHELVDEAHEGWWDTEMTLTTTASVAYVALADTVWRVQGVDILDSGDYRQLAQIAIGQRNRWGSQAGEPEAYRTSARGIELLPTPDAAYTLRLMHTPRAPLLAVSQPREWYNGWEDYVITSTLLKLDERESKPTVERERALDRVAKRIRSAASKRRQQEPEYLNLRESDIVDPYNDRGPY